MKSYLQDDDVLFTKEYHIFKKYPLDHGINEKFLKYIMLSIKKENFLEHVPISITDDFFVLDGLHRLEAAKRLNIEIYYKIFPRILDQKNE